MSPRGTLLFLILIATLSGCTASDVDAEDASDSSEDMSVVMPGGDSGSVPADAAMASDAEPPPDLVPACPDLVAGAFCGKCGRAAQSCIDGKVVVTGACMNEGPCAPGEIVNHSDGCQFRACNGNCQWGPWTLKAGKTCAAGTSMSCNAGPMCPRAGRIDCLPTCKYGSCYCP